MSSMADGISNLPDAVICHILSFLPTKQSVATSVLSKRWKHLWRSVLTLDFSDIMVEDQEASFRFNEFVYSVLLARHSIKSFRLEVQYCVPHLAHLAVPSVIKWVNAVVQCGVECLHLNVDTAMDMPKLPISILSCRTLVVLKFYMFTVKGFSSVGLPSLKILLFEYINFPKVRDFMLLLAGCPILEELQTACIMFHSEDSLAYRECESLSLSKLTRVDMFRCYCHFPLKALHNVQYLRIEINKVYCRYDDIPTFHNLTHLELLSLKCNWHLLVEVLKHCPNIQDLELNEATVDGFRDDFQGNWVDPEFVPQCISLHLRICTFWDFLGLQGELLLARYILKNARILQTMTIWCKEQLETKRLLFSCPRASATCQLSVF